MSVNNKVMIALLLVGTGALVLAQQAMLTKIARRM